MSINLEDGRRVYRRWSQHPLAYRLMTGFAFFGRRESLRSRAITELNLGSGDRVLDLGCGMGPNLAQLSAAVGPEGQVIGLDVSEEMLDRARQTVEKEGLTNVELICADAADPGFGSESLDAVLAALSLSAVPDHAAAIDSVAGALRRGGRLVVFDAIPFKGVWSVLNPFVGPVFRRLTNWDVSADLPAEMADSGFEVEVETANLASAIIAVGIHM